MPSNVGDCHRHSTGIDLVDLMQGHAKAIATAIAAKATHTEPAAHAAVKEVAVAKEVKGEVK